VRVADDKLVVVERQHDQASHQAESAGEPAGRHRRAEAPIHIQRDALFNAAARKGDRVGVKVDLEDGKRKLRVFKLEQRRAVDA
jgi:ribosomal protein L24